MAIADTLESSLGQAGRWFFLLGAFGAVFSSLLGVWQSMPYLFADFWFLAMRGRRDKETYRVDTSSLPYRAYLLGIALVPVIGLVAVDFKSIQKTYAVVGAIAIPMLAIVLLVLNGRARWVGKCRNSIWTSLVLIGTLLFFLIAGSLQIHSKLFGPQPAALEPGSEPVHESRQPD